MMRPLLTRETLLHWQKQIEAEQVEAAKKRFPELSSTEAGAYRAGICAGVREIVSTLTLHGHLEGGRLQPRPEEKKMATLRMTNGTEVFSVTVDRQDDLGPAQAFDSRGGRYDRDDYNGGWTSDAADESVTIIADDESDEDAKTRLLAEVSA